MQKYYADKKEIDSAYRAEHQIEEVFRAWKDEMHLRPNFHMKDENIYGHIYLTFLSYPLIKKLEAKLKTLGINERGLTFLNRFDNIMLNLIPDSVKAPPTVQMRGDKTKLYSNTASRWQRSSCAVADASLIG